MPDTAPPTPTTLAEWSKSETYRFQLESALRQPYMVGAFAVLRQMNAPKPLPSSDLGAGALCHQFHAGWEACLKALRNLPSVDEASMSRARKAGEIESLGAWSWAGSPPDSASL